MKYTLLACVAILGLMGGAAMADVNCTGFGSNTCSDDDPVTNNGGQGGAGGAGGNAAAAAAAAAAQQQGQQQEQAQGQLQGQAQGQGQIAAQGQAQDASNQNSISIEGDKAAKIPVATAVNGAPNTNNPCGLSFGVGGQLPGFGGSIAGTTESTPCNDRENVEQLYATGHAKAATIYLCEQMDDDKVRTAMVKSGACPATNDEDAIAMGAYDVGPTRSAELDESDFGYTPARLGGGKLSRK